MGTTYHLKRQQFAISAEHIPAALHTLEASSGGYYDPIAKIQKRIEHYKHLPPILKLQELAEGAWGFRFILDQDETKITGIEWSWESCAEAHLFHLLASYIASQSFIEMRGDDGSHWRWIFENGKLVTLKPTITWVCE